MIFTLRLLKHNTTLFGGTITEEVTRFRGPAPEIVQHAVKYAKSLSKQSNEYTTCELVVWSESTNDWVNSRIFKAGYEI